MNCLICGRLSDNDEFCSFHLAAYKNLIQQYDAWRKGLGISWKDYLREIEMNSVTGEWAREVASYLYKKEEAKDVG